MVSIAPAGAHAATNNIFTVAGTGTLGFTGDGGRATSAAINGPTSVALLPDGGYLFTDNGNNRVRRVLPNGTISTVAGGGGTAGTAADGGPATAAALSQPISVIVQPDGSFLFSEASGHRVRRVSSADGGTITTVAGTGTATSTGDGGPATSATLNQPDGLAAHPAGGYLIAERNGRRVRRVGPGGEISTLAGTGAAASTGDGGPATSAAVDRPAGVAVRPDGSFLITEVAGQRVREVSPGGTISTIAGDGTSASTGDGGPAVAAQTDIPYGVAVAGDGSVLFAEYATGKVRRVTPEGRILTLAGGGASNPGDGGPATSAFLQRTSDVEVTRDGGVLIPEFTGHRIRYVDADLRGVAGPTGATGPGGAAGPGGPPGPPGTDGATVRVIAVAIAQSRVTARLKRRFSITYAATDPGTATLDVLDRRNRRVATVRGRAKAGRNTIRATVKKTGKFTLRLTLRSGEASTTDRIRLTVKKR
jgi:hypothetical protein